MRPAAKELQQHEFVRGTHGSARTQALQPLIERSRENAAALLAELEGPPKLPPGVRCAHSPDAFEPLVHVRDHPCIVVEAAVVVCMARILISSRVDYRRLPCLMRGN